MAALTMDTSGRIECAASFQPIGWAIWSDLDPFTQGYIEALFATQIMVPGPDGPEPLLHPAFSDLAPETLAAILKDCERYQADTGGELLSGNGHALWTLRNGSWGAAHGYPPLTATLSDDGKVRFQ